MPQIIIVHIIYSACEKHLWWCSTSVCKSFVHHINCASLRFLGVLVFDGKCVLDVMDESQELFIINTSTWMFKRLNTDHHFYIHTNITARQHSILLSALCDHIQFIYMSVYAINPSRFRMILWISAHAMIPYDILPVAFSRFRLNGSEDFGACTVHLSLCCCSFNFHLLLLLSLHSAIHTFLSRSN